MTSPVMLDDVAKWYGDVMGVNGISGTLEPGVTGLLGANGSGKTTLLKLIAGLLAPSRGHVEIFGKDPRRHVEVYRRLGFSHDGEGFYDALTGMEMVRHLLQFHGYRGRRLTGKALEALELMGLNHSAERPVGAYSKGMKQRLKIALAIGHDPDVILLDEPLAGMDPVGRRKTLELVTRWGEQGRVVLISSHILHEIESLTPNIMMLSQGRLLAKGDVHEVRDLLRDHPHQIYVECPDPRRLSSRLIGLDAVQRINFEREHNGILMETFQPDLVYDKLAEIVVEEEIEVELMTSPDDNVQAVFEYLTHGRTEETS